MIKKIILKSSRLTRLALGLNNLRLRNTINLKLGKHSVIGFSSTLEGHNAIGSHTSFMSSFLGYGSYIGNHTEFINTKIGRFCSIGSHVSCIYGNHPTNTFVSTHPSFFSVRKQAGFTYVEDQLFEELAQPPVAGEPFSIVIGNDVWIGNHVKILDGTTIGDGAVIASNSLVNKDVPAYTIAGGSPAKPIRQRFEEDDIEFLTELRWWNKSPEWIAENAHLFKDISLLKSTLNGAKK